MKLLTVKQVAEILQVTEQTVYNLMSQGELEKVKIGRANRVKEEDLMQYINQNTATGKPQTEHKPRQGVEYISTKETARQLDKSLRTVQRYINQGKLEGYKDGHNWQVSKQSIKEYQEGKNE